MSIYNNLGRGLATYENVNGKFVLLGGGGGLKFEVNIYINNILFRNIMTEWSDDIEKLLSEVRENCITLNKYHLRRYYKYKQCLPFFKMPVLVLSAVNSVFSVGLQPYMEQSLISVLNCIVSLVITLINSIELYMGIQKSMESEMLSSQGYYILSIDIYKTISLKREHRDTAGKQYLTECYNKYEELIKKSKLIKDTTLPDMLQSINTQMFDTDKCVSIHSIDSYESNLTGNIVYYNVTEITPSLIQDEETPVNYGTNVTATAKGNNNNNNISEDDELLFPTNV